MTHIPNFMQAINFNTYKRRVTLGSRSVFTIPDNNNLSSLKSLRYNSYNLSSSNSPRANKKTRKVIARSFRNRKLCKQFMSKLQNRYSKRFKQLINFRINIRGNKIEYYAGKKI